MATADSVKAKIQGLIDAANAVTGIADVDLTSAFNTLVTGYGQGGGGASGIYMAQVTPETDLDDMTITHGLGSTDILLVACWAETLGDFVPETTCTLAKFWAKTGITTQRSGNGFSPGYSWDAANQYASPSSPNTAAYETLTVIDENSISIPRAKSGTGTTYPAGVTYTVIVIAANEEA